MGNYTKDIVRVNRNGREIYGVLSMPLIESKHPIVIFSHGYNGSHENFAMESDYLASNGVATYCFDFCGGSVNSKSGLKTTEMTLFTEKEDLCAVIDYFKSYGSIDDIFLFGASQGGLVTAMTAEDYAKDIKGILLLFPAFCIADNWNATFPELKDIPDTQEFWDMKLGRKFFETIRGYDIFKDLGKFTHEVLMFNGDQDQVATVAYCEKALKVYSHAKLKVFKGEGHGFSEAGKKKVAMMMHEFVKHNGKG